MMSTTNLAVAGRRLTCDCGHDEFIALGSERSRDSRIVDRYKCDKCGREVRLVPFSDPAEEVASAFESVLADRARRDG